MAAGLAVADCRAWRTAVWPRPQSYLPGRSLTARAALDEYVPHYNQHRPHRARNLRPPDCDDITMAPVTDLATARMRRHNVLGGLIHEYERAA